MPPRRAPAPGRRRTIRNGAGSSSVCPTREAGRCTGRCSGFEIQRTGEVLPVASTCTTSNRCADRCSAAWKHGGAAAAAGGGGQARLAAGPGVAVGEPALTRQHALTRGAGGGGAFHGDRDGRRLQCNRWRRCRNGAGRSRAASACSWRRRRTRRHRSASSAGCARCSRSAPGARSSPERSFAPIQASRNDAFTLSRMAGIQRNAGVKFDGICHVEIVTDAPHERTSVSVMRPSVKMWRSEMKPSRERIPPEMSLAPSSNASDSGDFCNRQQQMSTR